MMLTTAGLMGFVVGFILGVMIMYTGMKGKD